MSVKNDHRSKFSNLSNWKEEAWKNQGFNGIRTRDLHDTGAMLYRAMKPHIGSERVNLLSTYLPVRSEMMWSTYKIIHIWTAVVDESEKWSSHRWSPDFFRFLLSNCLNWKIYCDDHSSLWSTTAVQIWIIIYINFIKEMSLLRTFVGRSSVSLSDATWRN